MLDELAKSYAALDVDSWRARVGFADDLENAMAEILAPGISDDEVKKLLGDWLARNQPCLFGRIAAKKGLIVYCILRQEDLLASDELVRRKIQQARLEWHRQGWNGAASGFVLVVISDKLARAAPGPAVLEIAKRLGYLYLNCDMEPDQIYLDEIFLEIPNRPRNAWRWAAGVNYFSAQGDGRWWQDHRMPVGMAFSVNSVGHMVKSGRLTEALRDLDQVMETSTSDFHNHNIDSLEKALEMAMRTINMASVAPSGRATELLPRSSVAYELPVCPIELPAFLGAKNHCEYRGLYHTDITLPGEYFLPNIERPADLPAHLLDFTYLFHRSLENPDHLIMGPGLQIRHYEEDDTTPGIVSSWELRSAKGKEVEVRIEDVPMLREALGR